MLLILTVLQGEKEINKDFVVCLFVTITSFAFFILVTVKISEEIQFNGAQKYLDKEIVINKFNVQYDSQNQPIDTTYIFKYVK